MLWHVMTPRNFSAKSQFLPVATYNTLEAHEDMFLCLKKG